MGAYEVGGVIPPDPDPDPSESLITNSTFDVNTAGWSMGYSSGASGSLASVTESGYSGKAGKVTVNNGGTSAWSVQLRYNVAVTSGKTYNLKFKASADASRTIGLVLQQNTSPYSTWMNNSNISLTTTPTTFGPYTFNCVETDTTNLLKFLLGGNTTNVYIDDVEFVEAVQEVNNIVINPTFDVNTTGWSVGYSSDASGSFASVTKSGYSGKVCKETINNGGSSAWSVQLRQNVAITAGKTYTLKFKASADASRTIGCVFQQNASPYSTWWTQSGISLTTTPTSFGPYTFDCTTGDATNLLKFLLGDNTSNVYIDEVEITETTTLKSTQVIFNDNQKQNQSLTVYPNPAQSILRVSNLNTTGGELVIINMSGQIEKTISTDGQVNLSIDLSNLTRGVYVIKQRGINNSSVVRFVKN
ncbi:MAG: carbohydrate binding domain-containing protein [Salinivirgaceae bacterium]|nr:carbohydrate binding domain-containing protein [Salinivirgaceae bacterium]